MRTFYDIIVQATRRGQISSTVAFHTDAILNDSADNAHKWAAGYKKFPATEGRVSTTFASYSTNEDGYLVGEYPEGWKPDSIRLLTIDGKKVHKKNFYQFQKYLEDNSNTSERIFSDFGRRIYLNPDIDLSGTVTAWGQYTPALWDFTDNTVTTAFSDAGMEDGNEAIVEEMLSHAAMREKKLSEAEDHHKRAMRVLDELWKLFADEQFGYGPTDSEGIWERVDVLAGSRYSDTIKRNQWY